MLTAALTLMLAASPQLTPVERARELKALDRRWTEIDATQPSTAWFVPVGLGLGAGVIAMFVGAFSGISCHRGPWELIGTCVQPGLTSWGVASLVAGLSSIAVSAAGMIALVIARAGPGKEIHRIQREMSELEAR